MSRAGGGLRNTIRRSAILACLGWSLVVAPASTFGQEPSRDALPTCRLDTPAGRVGCALPAWPDDAAIDVPPAFGTLDPASLAWVDDPAGDTPNGGLDILGVGVARLEVTDAEAARRSPGLAVHGRAGRAIDSGPMILVRMLLAMPPEDVSAPHTALFLITDVDGQPANDGPTDVDLPDWPFAGLQDVYSFHVAPGADEPLLLSSDLRRDWYGASEAFAVARPTPSVIDFLIRPTRLGDEIRLASFVEGDAGGYDVVRLGASAGDIPLDGIVQRAATCLSGRVANDPVTVDRVVQNGQSFRRLELPWSWRVGIRLPLTAAERGSLLALIEARDDDGDGGIELQAAVDLLDDGLVLAQGVPAELRLEGDEAVIELVIGLTRRGYHAVTGFALEPTGDAAADLVLAALAEATERHLPPFVTARRAGRILGAADSACLPDEASSEPADA